MCLLDARCRCETGFCSHTDTPFSLNSLFIPQLLNQAQEPFTNEIQSKIIHQKNELLNPIVKKFKRDNDFTPSQSETKSSENLFQDPIQGNIQIQPSLLPLLNLQLLQPLINNNNNGNNNNNITNNSFLVKQPQVFPAQSTNQNAVQNNNNNNNLETMLKEMQARVMGMFAFQSKMLTDLQEKSNIEIQTVSILLDEVKQLKKKIDEPKSDAIVEKKKSPIYNQIAVSNEACSIGGPISPQGLIQFLFKKKESDYKYRLILNTPLDQPLYRERNFSINVSLVDRDDNAVINMNRIPLNISIYTSENTPKFIDTNTSGNKILKGYTDKDMLQGQITFDKIQIKEVTSHFRNGWVFLVIYPKSLNYESGKNMHHKDDIDMDQIRPLVIEKVIVKAKKLKEGKKNCPNKDQCEDSKDMQYEKIEEMND